MAVATLVSAIADLAADARERRALLAKQASSSRSPPSPTQRPELVDHSTVTWAMLLVLAVGAGFIIGRATMLADAGTRQPLKVQIYGAGAPNPAVSHNSTSSTAALAFTLPSAKKAAPKARAAATGGAVTGASKHPHRRVRLFVGVLSASRNRDKRDAIRATWGADHRLQRVVVVMMRPGDPAALDRLREEALQHDDIILVGHVQEQYEKITAATLEVFRAAVIYHGPVSHVMKVDDDTFVAVGRLLHFLAARPLKRSWSGHIHDDYMPIRIKDNPWEATADVWPLDLPGPIHWANGPGYILTMDLAKEIAAGLAVRVMPKHLYIMEDISVGIWMAYLMRERGFNITYGGDKRFNPGTCTEGDIISHYVNATTHRCMFEHGDKCC